MAANTLPRHPQSAAMIARVPRTVARRAHSWHLVALIVTWATLSLGGVIARSSAADAPPHRPTTLSARTPRVIVESVRPARGGPQATRYGLTDRDVAAMREVVPSVITAVPSRVMPLDARRGEEALTVRSVGTTADASALHGFHLTQGRFLSTADGDSLRTVAVLSNRVARGLFPHDEPVGQTVRLGRHAFVVVGVLTAEAAAQALDVFIPLSTMRARYGDTILTQAAGAFEAEQVEISRVELAIANAADVPQATATVVELLNRLHDDRSYRVTDSTAIPAPRPEGASP